MKKALSILLALVMVIGVFPTFADKKADDKKAEKPAVEVSASEKALEALKGYGAIKGDGTADPFKMESELKRQNAAVILVRLLGVENDAKATEVKEKPFTDLPNDDFYKSIIQYVKAKGIFKGTSSEKFGFNEAITAQQFATINLRALGYEVDTDEAYGKALETAKKLGLLKDASALENNTKILRKDVYVIMNNTLDTPKKDGKKALKYELGYATEPVVEKLEVVDAMANGLKILKVEFTKAVDEESLKSIEITDKDENDVKFEVYLAEDSKVANLALDKKADQNATYKVVVKDVKSEDRKEKVEKFEKKVLFVDTERPSISSVEALNPREIVIAVSEPMDLESKSYKKIKEIKIDDKEAYAKVENNFDGKLMLTLYKPLKEGEHKVVIEGLKDFAGLPSAAYEQDITVVDDKEAPAATEAKLLTSKSIKVTFNENLEKIGEFKVNGEKAKGEYHKKNNKKDIELTLSKELGMGAIVEVKVEYKGQKDIMNNEVKNWEKITFSVADDTDLPTAEFKGFDKDDATKVQIQFSKAMNKEGEFKLKDAKGKVVQSGTVGKTTLVNYEDEGKKTVDKSVLVFELKELKDKDPKDYTLVLEKFKDATVRHNEMPKTEIEFKGKDTKLPEVVDKGYDAEHKDGEHIFTIAFTEKMNQDTLKDKTNYTVKDVRFDQIKDTKIKVLEDGRKVQLIIKADAATYSSPSYSGVIVKLIGLKDENDQKLLPVDLTKKADVAPQVVGKPEVTRNDKNEESIKVKFDKKVRILDASNFVLAKGSLGFEGDVDNYADEFTFVVDGYEFKDDLADAPTFTIKEGAVVTARGTKNAVATPGLKDGIAARIALDKDDQKMIEVTNPETIKLTFTEELSAVVAATVSKENHNVPATATIDTDKKIVNIKVPAMKTGEEYTISIVVKDKVKDGNSVESGIIKESITVTSLDSFEQTLKAKLVKGTVADQVKIVIENPVGDYHYKLGKELPAIGHAVDSPLAITTPDGFNVNPAGNAYITVYKLAADNKVVSYKVLETAGFVYKPATAPTTMDIKDGTTNGLTFNGGSVNFLTSLLSNPVDATATSAFGGSNNTFTVEATQAGATTAKIVLVGESLEGATAENNYTIEKDGFKAEDIKVTKAGTVKVSVIISETNKDPLVYTANVVVN
ncbi:MAG: S-layer homology domain-containing protein [Bacillota bacterium]|nr:S-layer homology domain-containing protein [Bacillota bacterium]